MPKPPEVGHRGKEPKGLGQALRSPRSQWHLLAVQSSAAPSSRPETPAATEEETVGPVFAWLQAWEVRQERLLRRHEEALRQQVEALRKDLQKPEARLHVETVNSLPTVTEFVEKRATGKWSECRVALSTPSSNSREVGTAMSQLSPASLPMGREPDVSTKASKKPRQARRPQCGLRAGIYDFVHSRCFAAFSGTMIVVYTLAMGVMAELEMRLAVEGHAEPRWLSHVDSSFAVFFFAELVLRVLSDGRSYFLGAKRNWNAFDAFVALSGLADIFLGTRVKTGFLRILRACRIIRVLRVMQTFRNLKTLGYLQLMTESLVSCLPCMGWGLVLLGALQYVFAVILLRGAKEELRRGTLSARSQEILRESFNGLQSAMFSLTQAISGGRGWADFVQPFTEVSAFYGLSFPLFIIFFNLGAMNILTGIFVESTSSIAKQNKELAVQEEIARAEHFEEQIREFFQDLDIDDSGTLSREELAKSLKDPKVKAYFSAVLQIDVSDSQNLFHLLDQNNDGKVSMKEFVEKCLRLRGTARAMDVAMVRKEYGMMKQQFKALVKAFDEKRNKHQKGAS